MSIGFSMPSHCLQSLKKLRDKFTITVTYNFPAPNDKNGWRRFCYGPQRKKIKLQEVNLSSIQQDLPESDVESDGSGDLDEQQNFDKSIVGVTENPNWVDDSQLNTSSESRSSGHQPYVSIIAQLSHVNYQLRQQLSTIKILGYHIQWLSDDISAEQVYKQSLICRLCGYCHFQRDWIRYWKLLIFLFCEHCAINVL